MGDWGLILLGNLGGQCGRHALGFSCLKDAEAGVFIHELHSVTGEPAEWDGDIHSLALRQSEVKFFGLQDDGVPGEMGRTFIASATVLYIFMSILIIPVMCTSEAPTLWKRHRGLERLYNSPTPGGFSQD